MTNEDEFEKLKRKIYVETRRHKTGHSLQASIEIIIDAEKPKLKAQILEGFKADLEEANPDEHPLSGLSDNHIWIIKEKTKSREGLYYTQLNNMATKEQERRKQLSNTASPSDCGVPSKAEEESNEEEEVGFQHICGKRCLCGKCCSHINGHDGQHSCGMYGCPTKKPTEKQLSKESKGND